MAILDAIVDRLTGLLTAIAGLLIACGAFVQAIRNKKTIAENQKEMAARVEIIERRSGHDRRASHRE